MLEYIINSNAEVRQPDGSAFTGLVIDVYDKHGNHVAAKLKKFPSESIKNQYLQEISTNPLMLPNEFVNHPDMISYKNTDIVS